MRDASGRPGMPATRGIRRLARALRALRGRRGYRRITSMLPPKIAASVSSPAAIPATAAPTLAE